jgi:outer membrane lipoprotein LolB
MRRVAALAALLLAAGCATIAPPESIDGWPARRAALQALQSWTLDGRIAVAAGENGFSGGFDWQQRGADADIEISGPMGGSAMSIRVVDGKAVVSMRGESDSTEDAAQVFARYFGPGHQLPVTAMRYWLVGAPAPGQPHEETLGDGARLASLSQSGWLVRYDRYAAVGERALPDRIEMTTEGLRLRVVVSDWQLPP